MNAAAVICECNPPHRGHEWIFRRAREMGDCVVAVMSGNFVQRGECAVFDKTARAESLLRLGVDLVVEHPFPWCAASAEFFARGGVSVAEKMHCETLVFGASSDDRTHFMTLAKAALDRPFDPTQTEKNALGYAAAVQNHLLGLSEGRAEYQCPNDILAAAYCAEILKNGYKITLNPRKRLEEQDGHPLPSATDLRDKMTKFGFPAIENDLPEPVSELLRRDCEAGRTASAERLFSLALAKYRLTDALPETAESAGGVNDRLQKAAEQAENGTQMLTLAATKKYTNARLRRAALFFLLGLDGEILRESPRYTLVLAANKVGCEYLAQLRKTADLEILTKPAAAKTLSPEARKQYEYLVRADRLYTLCLQKIPTANEYLTRSPVIYGK